MAEFKALITTKNGDELIANALLGKSIIQFTKIAVSSTTYTDEQLKTLTALGNQRQEVPVSNVRILNSTTIQVEGAINNQDLTVGYYMQTVGLYAKDKNSSNEILFAVVSASTAGYMPAYNGKSSTGAFFKLSTTMSSTANVSVAIDPAAYASVGDVQYLQYQIDNTVSYTDKDTKTGTFLSTKYADDALVQVNIKGKSEQVVTVQDKNEFSTILENGGYGTATVGQPPGKIESDIRSRTKNPIQVSSLTQYTINAKTTVASKTLQFALKEIDSVGNLILDTGWKTLPYTFTTSSSTKKIMFNVMYSDNLQIDSSNITEIQLEKGPTATTYVPFVPTSPSPDYPSPIISPLNFDLVSNCKNLIDVPEGLEVGAANIHRIIDLSPNQTHLTVTMSKTLKVANTALGSQHWIFFRDGNGNNITSGRTICGMSFSTVGETKSASQTIEIPNNARKAVLYVNPYFGANSSTFISNYVQVEYGSTATPYTPYKEHRINIPYPMRSLPNGVCDEIKDGFHIQRVGTYTFTGNESFHYQNPLTNTREVRILSRLLGAKEVASTSNALRCTTFKAVSLTWGVDTPFICSYAGTTNDNSIAFRLPNEAVPKTWFAENSTTIEFELATPIYTPLATYLKSFKDVTNVYSTSNPQIELTGVFKSRLWTFDYNTKKSIDSKIATEKIDTTFLSQDWNSVAAAPLVAQLKGETDKLARIRNATISTSWTGSTAPYTQDIAINGITSSDCPVVDLKLSSTLATAQSEIREWNKISRIVTGQDKITVYCYLSKPTIALNIQLKGV